MLEVEKYATLERATLRRRDESVKDGTHSAPIFIKRSPKTSLTKVSKAKYVEGNSTIFSITSIYNANYAHIFSPTMFSLDVCFVRI